MTDHDSKPIPPVPLDEASWVHEPGLDDDSMIAENWLFRLRRQRFRSRRSGKAHDFFVMSLADAVNVIALTPEGAMVLVRQFRAGSGRDSLEPPGGLLDPGEDPCAAAARELLEETGYAGDPAEFLGSVYSNPSIMTSRFAVVVVRAARRVAEPKLDAGEEVAVELVAEASIPGMIRAGEINHGLSVMGLLWYFAAGPLTERR